MTFVNDLFDLTGKTAVVTGASAGIGNRLARTLVMAGADVVSISRRVTDLDEEATATGRIRSVQADLAVHDQVVTAAEACLEMLDGRVDILVNNAGWVSGGTRAEDETPEIIERTLAINLVAPITLAQAFLPGMRDAGGGSIVNISSISAIAANGRFPQAVYAASKGGIEAMSREWAVQWARHGIRVNTLAPGFIASEITSEVLTNEKVLSWVLRNSMIQRHGEPEDFDGALLLLASDASRYITGQQIVVDGGWTAH
jgi:NAD(P)-dependent dehydrogenase (short-subunit alcohol dehydrogenase family)